MVPVRDQPLLTEAVQVNIFKPEAGSAYLFGSSGEERSEHSSEWERQVQHVKFIRITVQESASFEFATNGASGRVALRSREQLQNFWNTISSETIYIDITGSQPPCVGSSAEGRLVLSGAAGNRFVCRAW